MEFRASPISEAVELDAERHGKQQIAYEDSGKD